MDLRGAPLLPWRMRQQIPPKFRYHIPHKATSCTGIPYSEYIFLSHCYLTAGTVCTYSTFVVSTYRTVRNHNPEEYNKNSYSRHDNSKSHPSTDSESNLWTSKAIAWTVLEIWGDCTMWVSGGSWTDSGEGVGCSGRTVLLRFEEPCIVALLLFNFFWNAGSLVPLIST